MANTTNQMKTLHDIVAEALKPYTDKITERFSELWDNTYEMVERKMDEVDGIYEQAFPYPNGRQSRADYKQAVSLRQESRKFIDWLSASHYSPNNRTTSFQMLTGEALITKKLEWVTENVNNLITTYVGKMVNKLVTHESGFGREAADWDFSEATAEYTGVSPWNGSTLKISHPTGGDRTLTTKIILNVSPLGTLFNQFPTRFV